MNKRHNWALKRVKNSILQAREGGLKVSIGLEDATRSDAHFIQEIARVAERNGAQRIRLADTVGIASPLQTHRMVKSIKSKLTHCDVAE